MTRRADAPRRIAVVTGTRADYGLLQPLMAEIRADAACRLLVVATGMHLSPEFGMTVTVIRDDGYAVDDQVAMLLSGDSPVAIAKSLGLGVIGFADSLARLKPDILVVLGDRFEILAAAQAAMMLRIPVAHIHGGETTEGVVDEAIRHSITKMAHLHFAAAEPYRRRIIQLGEDPRRVFTVGAAGLDAIARLPVLDRAAMEERLGLALQQPVFAVTYHPVTLESRSPAEPLAELLAALEAVPEATVVLTKSNADTYGRIINRMIDAFADAKPDRRRAVMSLGQIGYLSLLRHSSVVVGNSSSGLLEAPSCGVPTVNIGDRQRGRLRAPSVIDCAEDRSAIGAALEAALSPAMQAVAARRESPFGAPGCAGRVHAVLRDWPLEGLLKKQFHDVDVVGALP